MSYTIPLRNDLPHYTLQVELDGSTYGLELFWNSIEPGWFMSIFSADGTPLVEGVRFVVDWPLTKRYRDARLPPGVLMAQDTTGKHADPGRDDLGARTLLLYFTAAEVAEL